MTRATGTDMQPSSQMAPAFETITVNHHRVSCDGGGALGHPRIYLDLGEDGRAVCPYCSRLYLFQADH